MTSSTEEKPKRLLIVGGHVRPEPLIETGIDPLTGRKSITREEHYAPAPVHLALDPDTGIVYGGMAPHLALGIDPPDEAQSDLDAQREYQEFLAYRADKKSDLASADTTEGVTERVTETTEA